MYKLYEMTSRTMIDISPVESDIIKTLNDEIKENLLYKMSFSYLVLSYQNEEPNYIYINSFEDFISYIEDYRKRTHKDINKKVR